MRKLLVPMLGLWLGLGVSGRVFAAEAGEHQRGQEISMSDLPAPVKATFEKESKGGKVEELRKDTGKNGETVYFGEVVKNGKGSELKVSESGKVLHKSKAHDESKEKGEKGESK
jgi:hypothetical protein